MYVYVYVYMCRYGPDGSVDRVVQVPATKTTCAGTVYEDSQHCGLSTARGCPVNDVYLPCVCVCHSAGR